MKYILIGILSYLMTSYAFAQKSSSKNINSWVGAGYTTFDFETPSSQDFTIDDSPYFAAGGEKAIGAMNLYLAVSLSYHKTQGAALYNYTSNEGTSYTSGSSKVSFDMETLHAGLGLKIKLIDNFWFRPYIEAGGIAGYFKIDYKNLEYGLDSPPDTGYRKSDSLFDLGYYGEAGFELSFTEKFGIRGAAKYEKNNTQKFETLSNQKIKYETNTYYLSFIGRF